ncbi:MAG: hypothetical protein CHACPFDD_00159 [Phycisphaerae bacterium]|nr:hypothetical protein [Phycisphaerae bacterium]
MKLSLRNFEHQARLSVACAVLGGLATLAALGLILRRFDWGNFMFSYNARGPIMYLLAAALGASLLLAAIGFGLGLSSAGQKKNKQSRLSWIGFFVNAGVIVAAMMTGLLFVFSRNPLILG